VGRVGPRWRSRLCNTSSAAGCAADNGGGRLHRENRRQSQGVMRACRAVGLYENERGVHCEPQAVQHVHCYRLCRCPAGGGGGLMGTQGHTAVAMGSNKVCCATTATRLQLKIRCPF
jgi:hypothetical protein